MSATRRWIVLKLAALAGAIVAYVQGAVELAAVLLGVAVVLFLAAWWVARPQPLDDAAVYRIARDAVVALPRDGKLLRHPVELWARADAHLRTAGARMEHAEDADASAMQAVIADLIHRCFTDPKSRKKLDYAAVDRLLDACEAVVPFGDGAHGPVARALDERMWVELRDEPLQGRVEILRRGVPDEGPLRSKGFDGPVFKRWVRDGVS